MSRLSQALPSLIYIAMALAGLLGALLLAAASLW
jgi:hypothetical protein